VKKLYRHLVHNGLVIFGLCLTGCLSPRYSPPVEGLDQPPRDQITTHRIEPGETLYSLAWRYGTTVERLIETNSFEQINALSVGQIIRLPSYGPGAQRAPEPESTESVGAQIDRGVVSTPQIHPTDGRSDSEVAEQHTGYSNLSGVQWAWPSEPRILSRFSANDRRRQGIDLAGELGDSVMAASDGRVVYAGDAIAGLGHLIIIDHGHGFLSAYAHNNKLLVDEGAEVNRGELIAEMGNSGTDRVKLHFEIRSRGVPIDPMIHLPKL